MSEDATFRPTVATIDLGAVRHNCTQLLGAIGPGAGLLAVVKADAYGHGDVHVARACLAAGAGWLGVALVEEGIRLRHAGIDAPILLLGELTPGAAGWVVAKSLTPSVWSRGALQAAERAASDAGVRLAVHVAVDTGMHREGAGVSEAVELAVSAAQSRSLRLEGLWTHLAVADEQSHPATAAQLAAFAGVVEEASRRGARPDLVHAANSAAALSLQEARFDMVRAGIAIYGVPPAPWLAGRADLRPAMRVSSRVVAVRRVHAGEGVSYGLTWSPDRDSDVAVVPIGYADGFPRLLSNSGEAVIAGMRRPVVGRVTMDHVLVACDGVQPGDEVVLLGDGISADEIAAHAGTISYEVLCAVSARVPRIYVP